MVSIESNEVLIQRYPKWRYMRTDRNGTRYFHDCTCKRCGGRGVIEGYRYIEGGVCFECGGNGVGKGEEIKVYTPEHNAKLAAQREARAKKAQVEREAKAIAERKKKLLSLGFGCEDGVYVIYRVVGNTFQIKDELKALGCKFNPCVGWYSAKNLEEYECQRMEETAVLEDTIYVEWKDANLVKEIWLERTRAIKESTSEWQGEVGAKIDITVHIDRVFESEYIYAGGWRSSTSHMYLMHDESGNIYKWSSSTCHSEGEDIHMIATVKNHTEYNGIKQTQITRPKILK